MPKKKEEEQPQAKQYACQTCKDWRDGYRDDRPCGHTD